MSKQILGLLCLAGLGLLAGCSNDEPEIGKGKEPTPKEELKNDSTLVEIDGVKFGMSEVPFGADIEDSTRTPEPPARTDTIDLCEGVSAEVTLEREKLPATRAVRRQLPDGSYRLYANRGTEWHVMHFNMVSNRMYVVGPKIMLEPGTYDFYCSNDKVTLTSDHKFHFDINNAGSEMFGVVKNVAVGGPQGSVTMLLTRISARIRVRLSAMMDFQQGAYTAVTSQPSIVTNMFYDPAINDYTGQLNGTLPPRNLIYTSAPDIAPSTPAEQIYGTLKSIVSQNYCYVFMGTTPSKLALRFQGSSKLYGANFYQFGIMPFQSSVPHLYANGSYVLRMRLIPNFRYLFNDGTVGYLRNIGNRVATALVFNNNLGIALYDAHPVGYPTELCPVGRVPYNYTPSSPADQFGCWTLTYHSYTHPRIYHGAPINNFNYATLSWQEAINNNPQSGRYWTWNPAGTTTSYFYFGSGHSGNKDLTAAQRIKGTSSETIGSNTSYIFPAFYWAGQYPLVKIQEFQAAGRSWNPLFYAKERWFLPTANEWHQFIQAIGFCGAFASRTPGQATENFQAVATCYSNIIDYALKRAGGTPLWDNTGEGYNYWTSTELTTEEFRPEAPFAFAFLVSSNNRCYFLGHDKRVEFRYRPRFRIRSFISF